MTEPKLDPSEVEALWVRHAADLRRLVLGVLRDRELAEEAVQQTFLTALERGHTADASSRKGWLFKVAFHCALEQKRRGATSRSALVEVFARGPSGAFPDPAAAAERDEAIGRLRAAIRSLPRAQRRVVEMRMLESKTFAVIADELGVPLGTALTRMRLATGKLRDALGDQAR